MSHPDWPVVWPEHSRKNTEGAYTPEQITLAEELAVSSLRTLTLNRVGLARYRAQPTPIGGLTTWERYSTMTDGFVPSAFALRHGSYGHDPLPCRQKLVAPVESINEIRIAGEIVDPAEYAVEDRAYLVRRDGSHWLPRGDMVVDYYSGVRPGMVAQMAAGLLAEEFLAGMGGDECRLPRGVTEYSRMGVSITVEAGLFPDGMTNIPEVDAFIRNWNPHGLKTMPQVMSPDISRSPAGGRRYA